MNTLFEIKKDVKRTRSEIVSVADSREFFQDVYYSETMIQNSLKQVLFDVKNRLISLMVVLNVEKSTTSKYQLAEQERLSLIVVEEIASQSLNIVEKSLSEDLDYKESHSSFVDFVRQVEDIELDFIDSLKKNYNWHVIDFDYLHEEEGTYSKEQIQAIIVFNGGFLMDYKLSGCGGGNPQFIALLPSEIDRIDFLNIVFRGHYEE